ncbi:family 14 glycosylhydrolase [Ningiella sp. W23]|uniref:family 14 glycosylhydrolase n=1 Tax=Ningiella sp. W23 TaxID=3023715 RepID=UPI0037582609
MAPLELATEEQWQQFDKELAIAKEMGVHGVSVDIWWGKVEKSADNTFDWSYYHKLAELLRKHQLQWIPIMSFHQCGGNVGDNCNIPIPNWIWTHFEGVSQEELMFKSEQGNYARETLAIWHEPSVSNQVYAQYREFMHAFETEFADFADEIQEINISMGSAGELRYPSYNGHDENTGYPTRGALQAFSEAALEKYREYLSTKFASIEDLNASWNREYAGFSSISPSQVELEHAFAHAMHHQAGPIRDFIDWYHHSLIMHGEKMLSTGDAALQGAFSNIPLGFKIPGIHWQMSVQGGMRRSAEIAAGLIPFQPYSIDNHFGYSSILTMAQQFATSTQRPLIVHFTALEMDNNTEAPAYSRAKTLVAWLGQAAHAKGLTIKGENALAAGVHHKAGWQHIDTALREHHYSGLTVLRLGDVTSNPVGHKEYTRLISSFHKTKAK